MDLKEHRCKRCGGELIHTEDLYWKCPYCGCVFDDESAKKYAKTLYELFDVNKQEKINNLRRCLYDAVTAENISSTEIYERCKEIKAFFPDDFSASFYEIAVGNDEKRLSHFIRSINVDDHYDEIDIIIDFLIRSLKNEFLLELNDLVDRAYKCRDLELYEKYSTVISQEAEKVESGVYETKLPREVFVAYSSHDMDKVIDLVSFLEDQGLRCFVAARNLRHGRGAVENYDAAIKEAIDHCRIFLFVSSRNSRTLSCDALEIELPYVRAKDIINAPAEYKNNYALIPHKYKKPRVEYRIEESKKFNAADEITNEFFDGYERVYSKEEAASRIIKQIIKANELRESENGYQATSDIKEEPKKQIKRKNRGISNKIRKVIYEIFAVIFLLMTLGCMTSVVMYPEMWLAVAFFAIISAMFFILAYSPKEKKCILGKDKGIPKSVFVIICIILAWMMIIINTAIS